MTRATLLLSVVALVAPSTLLFAQTMTQDPQSGNYVVRYQITGDSYEVIVPSADRISPRLELIGVSVEGGVTVYEYKLSNLEVPPAEPGRGLLTLMFECPRGTGALNENVPQPMGWRLRVYQATDGGAVCQFEAGLRGILDPGASVSGLRVRAGALPGLTRIDAVGVSGGGVITTGGDTPDTVYALVGYAESKGVTFDGVTPALIPAAITDPGNGTVALHGNLDFACGTVRWIDERGVCRSLQAKLQVASAALSRGQQGVAKNQLTAFRSELDAQRGKHLNDNAYFLLSRIADHTLSLFQ